MTPEQFCYWLQGFVEMNNQNTIDEKQWLIIKDHLKTVFKKVTPNRNDDLVSKETLDEMIKRTLQKNPNQFMQYPQCSWLKPDPDYKPTIIC